MASHTKEQRRFIICRLAAHYTPSEIVALFAVHWRDTRCDIADVASCDPRLMSLPPDDEALFKTERKRIEENYEEFAPTARRPVRLIGLHRMYEKARDNNQVSTAAALLAQIAIETGEAGEMKAGEKIARITRTIIDPAKQE